MKTAKDLIEKWHKVFLTNDLNLLEDIIADDAVFSSPVVFTPLEGKEITIMYLHAAGQSFNICNFKVMIRPFKAVQKVQEKMIEALESIT